MQSIYHYLRAKGLASNRGISESNVQKLTRLDIVNISQELNDICLNTSKNKKDIPFKHYASLSLGGGGEECVHIECRLKKLESLSRFAVMYSDRVLIRSFVGDCSKSEDKTIESLGFKFFNDLQLLWHIRPLIESGDIALTHSMGCICNKCICERFQLEMKTLKKLNVLEKKLAQKYFENTSLSIKLFNARKLWIEQKGPSPYFPHGIQGVELDYIPEQLKKRPRILKRLLTNKKIITSKTLQKEIGAHKDMALRAIHNVLYGLIAANYYKAPFVTHNPLHISCLNELADGRDVPERNNIAFETLTAEVPFLSDVSIRNLLRLRSREKDSFILYRKALNKTIDEFRNGNASTIKDAKQLYGDILAPELARMDRKVKLAAKDLRTTAIRSVTGTVGAISFGLCTGLIKPAAAPIITAIGLGKVASDIVKVMACGDGEKSITNEDMYFLWKTKQISQKK